MDISVSGVVGVWREERGWGGGGVGRWAGGGGAGNIRIPFGGIFYIRIPPGGILHIRIRLGDVSMTSSIFDSH